MSVRIHPKHAPVEPLLTDQRTGVSLVLSIKFSLSKLFAEAKLRKDWIESPNKAFQNHSPKDLLSSGSLLDFHKVNEYLLSNTT